MQQWILNSSFLQVAWLLLGLSAAWAGASNTGWLYAGLYPDGFWEHAEILEAAGAWAGQRFTFSGTFVSLDDHRDNILEKLEQGWQAQATPFVNFEAPGSASEVAAGDFDEALYNLDELRGFAPEKPYLIAQTGTAPRGGDRDGWLCEMFAVLTQDPNVVGFLYFNKDKSAWGGNEWDWRIFFPERNAGAEGFREGMQRASTRYQWPLSHWFQPGPLPLTLGF